MPIFLSFLLFKLIWITHKISIEKSLWACDPEVGVWDLLSSQFFLTEDAKEANWAEQLISNPQLLIPSTLVFLGESPISADMGFVLFAFLSYLLLHLFFLFFLFKWQKERERVATFVVFMFMCWSCSELWWDSFEILVPFICFLQSLLPTVVSFWFDLLYDQVAAAAASEAAEQKALYSL